MGSDGYTFKYAVHRERVMWQPDSTVVFSGPSPENATPESTHVPLPPQEQESTEIYGNSIVHYPMGASSILSESILLSRGGARRLEVVRMPSRKPKLELKSTRTLGEKEG